MGRKKLFDSNRKFLATEIVMSGCKLETIKQFIIIYVYFLKIWLNPLRFIYLLPLNDHTI